MKAQREFLRPCPLHLYRPARGPRKGRRLGLDGADRLAAEPAADPVRLDGDRIGGNPERIGQHIADIEGILRSRPDGQRARLPFRHGRARLDRRVGTEGHVKAQTDIPVARGRRAVEDRMGKLARPGSGIHIDAARDVGCRRSAPDVPGDRKRRGDGVKRARPGRDDAKAAGLGDRRAAILDDRDKARDALRRSDVPTARSGAHLDRCRCAQHPAIQHVRPPHIGGKERCAGDDLPPLRDFRAGADNRAGAKRAQLGHRARAHGDLPFGLPRRHRIPQRRTGLRQRFGKDAYGFAADGGLDPRPAGVMRFDIDRIPGRAKFGAGHLLERGGDVLAHFGARQHERVPAIAVRNPAKRGFDIRVGALWDHRNLGPDGGTRTDQGHNAATRGGQECAPPHQTASAARAMAARMRR